MRRKESRPIKKVSLNLFEDEFQKLRELHPRLGAGKVIREMVTAYLKRIEEEAAKKTAEVPTVITEKDVA